MGKLLKLVGVSGEGRDAARVGRLALPAERGRAPLYSWQRPSYSGNRESHRSQR